MSGGVDQPRQVVDHLGRQFGVGVAPVAGLEADRVDAARSADAQVLVRLDPLESPQSLAQNASVIGRQDGRHIRIGTLEPDQTATRKASVT
jgi:hypothetical protein